jgi:hypothetical protein
MCLSVTIRVWAKERGGRNYDVAENQIEGSIGKHGVFLLYSPSGGGKAEATSVEPLLPSLLATQLSAFGGGARHRRGGAARASPPASQDGRGERGGGFLRGGFNEHEGNEGGGGERAAGSRVASAGRQRAPGGGERWAAARTGRRQAPGSSSKRGGASARGGGERHGGGDMSGPGGWEVARGCAPGGGVPACVRASGERRGRQRAWQ